MDQLNPFLLENLNKFNLWIIELFILIFSSNANFTISYIYAIVLYAIFNLSIFIVFSLRHLIILISSLKFFGLVLDLFFIFSKHS